MRQSRWCRILSCPLDQLRRTSDPQNSRPRRIQSSAPDNRDLIYPSNVFTGRNKRVDPRKPTPPSSTALQEYFVSQSPWGSICHWTHIKAVHMFLARLKVPAPRCAIFPLVLIFYWHNHIPLVLVHSSLTHDWFGMARYGTSFVQSC